MGLELVNVLTFRQGRQERVRVLAKSFLGTQQVRTPPRRYPYFDIVVGLVWSHDPMSYAGCSLCYW
jgi:hypothetical protein